MKPKLMDSDDTSEEHKFVAEFDPTPSLLTALGGKLKGVALMITLRPENSAISKLGVGFNSRKQFTSSATKYWRTP